MGFSSDYVSARWTGYLLPEYSEEYTIHLEVDDGARLWIDEDLLVDFLLTPKPGDENYATTA